MLKAGFTTEVFEMFQGMQKMAEQTGLERITPAFLFSVLLELEDSPIYDAIFSQIDPMFFQEVIESCKEDMSDDLNAAWIQKDVANKNRNIIERIFKRKSKNNQDVIPKLVLMFKEETGGDELELSFDTELYDFVKKILEAFSNNKVVGINEVSSFLLQTMPADIRIILRKFGIDAKELKTTFAENQLDAVKEVEVKDDNKAFVLPKEFQGFVKNLNTELAGKVCDISGRDKECKELWQTMQKKTKRNAILIGEPGVGKTSIVEKITYDIINGQCPEEFKNMQVLLLDVTSSIAGTMYRGQAEERYSKLIKFLEENQNVILFIDEIHLIRGAGSTHEGGADLANAIKPILAGDSVRVIGATTRDEYEKYFSKDGAIKRRFRPIEVKEPKMGEVYEMLKKSIISLSKYHNVAISKEMVDFVILNAACFNNETKNPDRTKDLIDLAMVTAKQHGKLAVDKESVLENFNYSFNTFAKMSDQDKLATAYHEAGHAVVSICAEHLKNKTVKAVSIMPTIKYLGLTILENNDTFQDATLDYYIDEIASDLAGREAERMFTKTISSGASGDLHTATKYAEWLVSQSGMSDLQVNRTYEKNLMSEKVANSLNDQIDIIIAKSTERAKEILTSNSELLKAMADSLLKKGIIGEKTIKELVENFKAKS